MKRMRTAAALALSLLLEAGTALAQCAMCKAALTGSAEGQAMGAEFNRAILVMMAGPYLILGGFGVVLFRGRLRGTARRLAGRLLRTRR
jgi:hypothetical protein